jgi:hypothetical protein
MISPEDESDAASTVELRAIAEADQWLKHNQPIPHEQVLAEFGLPWTIGRNGRRTQGGLNGRRRFIATPKPARLCANNTGPTLSNGRTWVFASPVENATS